MKDVTIIIPARKGSVGLPGKNRFLFDYTASIIPDDMRENVVFTSDDEHLLQRSKDLGFRTIHRNQDLSLDSTSMRDVISNVVTELNLEQDHDVITLYLTYPQRTWDDVQKIYDFYTKNGNGSLLCRKELKVHPYMCFLENENHTGTKVVEHQLYRRQEYPPCFECCHYVVVTRVGKLQELDLNLFCNDTVFYQLQDKIFDIDYMRDLDNFKKDDLND
jgi:CMP-N-acetylneuraminic acid synthetase